MKKRFSQILVLCMVVILSVSMTTVLAATQNYNLGEAIQNESGWVHETKPAQSLDFNDGMLRIEGGADYDDWAVVTYADKSFADKMIYFTYKLESSEGDDIAALFLRYDSGDTFLWDVSGSSYFVWIKPDKVELQKWVEGAGTTVFSDKLTLNEAGNEYAVSFGAVAEGDNVRVKLIVDGVTIYDYIDTENTVEIFDETASFAVYAFGNPIILGGLEVPAVETPVEETTQPGDAGVIGFAVISLMGAAATVFGVSKKRK